MGISKSDISRFNANVFIFSILLSGLLASCTLDTSGLAPTPVIRPGTPVGEEGPPGSWSADAFPGFACPGDHISLEWNVGDPMCPAGTGPDCQTLTVTDSLGLLSTPFTSRQLTGTFVDGTVSGLASWSGADPVFTFSVAHDDPGDPGWVNATSEVVIVQNPPVDPEARNFSVPSASCSGTLGWTLSQYRLDMTTQEFINSTKGLGPCVRITSVCYLPNDASAKRPSPIVVSLVGGSMPAVTLSLGECVDGLSLPPNLAYDVQPVRLPIPGHEGNCIAGDVEGEPVTDPPYTQLLFTLRCDTTMPGCLN